MQIANELKKMRLPIALLFSFLLGACAHPITVAPLDTPAREDAKLIQKNVAYVMTEEDRGREVETGGGGGDRVKYLPYKDMEKAIRDALQSVYQDVTSIKSIAEVSPGNNGKINLIFKPSIMTESSSSSAFTWPPTDFKVKLSCQVMDQAGVALSQIEVIGEGAASFSEFKTDFGLAGRRAASDMSKKLREKIISDPKLQ